MHIIILCIIDQALRFVFIPFRDEIMRTFCVLYMYKRKRFDLTVRLLFFLLSASMPNVTFNDACTSSLLSANSVVSSCEEGCPYTLAFVQINGRAVANVLRYHCGASYTREKLIYITVCIFTTCMHAYAYCRGI